MIKYILILVAYVFAVAILFDLCNRYEIKLAYVIPFVTIIGGLIGGYIGGKIHEKCKNSK